MIPLKDLFSNEGGVLELALNIFNLQTLLSLALSAHPSNLRLHIILLFVFSHILDMAL